MASLVQFLAAGVAGAESGTAEFLLRGTASSAAAYLFDDFEELSGYGTNIITLDSNGSREVYCDVLADVIIRDSQAEILKTVTIGHSAPVVEVESASFLGTDYDGSPANTAGQPTTLQAILDKWITSAGGTDWNVLVDGSPVSLQDAFAALTPLGINVKAAPYSAAGDGVTDDSTAIAAATTAADGLPVFFPPGTYLCANLTIATAQINWVGSGAGATIIRGSGGSGNFLGLTDNTTDSWKKFQGIRFSVATGYDRLVRLESTQNDSFFDCDFDFTNCSVAGMDVAGAGRARVFMRSCRITAPAVAVGQLVTLTSDHEFFVDSCSFTLASGFTGDIIRGYGFVVSNCTFDGSALAGACHFIKAESSSFAGVYVGTFTGNTFIDNESGSFAFDLTDIDDGTCFVEQGNNFVGFTEPAASGDVGKIYDLSYEASALTYRLTLGSRKGRIVHMTHNDADDFLANAVLVAETVVIHLTDSTAAPQYFVSELGLPPGATANLIVVNESGTDNLDIGFYGARTGDATFSHGGEIVPDVDDDSIGCASYIGLIVSAGEPLAVVINAQTAGINVA